MGMVVTGLEGHWLEIVVVGIVFVVVFMVDRVATRVLGTADTCREFVYLVLVFGILMILCGLYLSL